MEKHYPDSTPNNSKESPTSDCFFIFFFGFFLYHLPHSINQPGWYFSGLLLSE